MWPVLPTVAWCAVVSPAFWGLASGTAGSGGSGEGCAWHSGAGGLQQLRMATYEDVYAFGAIMVEIVTGDP